MSLANETSFLAEDASTLCSDEISSVGFQGSNSPIDVSHLRSGILYSYVVTNLGCPAGYECVDHTAFLCLAVFCQQLPQHLEKTFATLVQTISGGPVWPKSFWAGERPSLRQGVFRYWSRARNSVSELMERPVI